jgi:hypothetical protein
MRNSYSSSKKGNKKNHQYPKFRQATGSGLDPARLANEQLKLCRPYSMVDSKGQARKNDHRCVVCSRIGKIFKLRSGAGKGFRGGVTKPRRATIMCKNDTCPKSYCSCECFNLWHVGSEFPK